MELSKYKNFDKSMAKKFGALYTGFGQEDSFEPVERVPLDCISLNEMLGGGLPVGRIVEVYGNNSVGKSTLVNHFVSSYQKQDRVCMWVDAEHAIDPEFMSYCGIDLNNLCKVAPNTAEDALEAIRLGMKMKDEDDNPILSLIVLDSVAALTPEAEFDDKNDLGSSAVGKLARLMSASLKQLVSLAAQSNITLVLINQERASNLMGYGPKSTTTGGNAVKYYCSIRLDLNRTGWLEESKKKVGQIITIETVKNKTYTPYKKAVVHLLFPTRRSNRIVAGVDVLADVVNVALEKEIINQAGAWFHWDGKKVQGISKVYNLFNEDEESYNKLYTQVKNRDNDTEENNDEKT